MKRIGYLLGFFLLCGGCASTPQSASFLREQAGGLPVFAAFVYEEDVHAVGKTFSTADWYWEESYPTVAESVRKADRFASYDRALTSGADLIVIAKNQVYGSRDVFKTSLVVYVRDSQRNLLTETGFQGKKTTREDAPATFQTLGQLMKDHIQNSRKVKTAVQRRSRK